MSNQEDFILDGIDPDVGDRLVAAQHPAGFISPSEARPATHEQAKRSPPAD